MTQLEIFLTLAAFGICISLLWGMSREIKQLWKYLDSKASESMYEMYKERYYEQSRKLDALYEATGYEYKTTNKTEAVKK